MNTMGGLFKYLKAAFSAKPLGMFVAPNWVMVAGFAMAGVMEPAMWLVGAGVELGYLLLLGTNGRFQRVVDGVDLVERSKGEAEKLNQTLAQLGEEELRRYGLLEQRCRTVLQQQGGEVAGAGGSGGAGGELKTQSEGLGRLLWIYLRLLRTRQSINRVLREADAGDARKDSIDARIAKLDSQLAQIDLNPDLRNSLAGQLEILRQRKASQKEARESLSYIDAELTRIQEQVELIREQAVLSSDPAVLSRRIDQIGATLGTTNNWIRRQNEILGTVEELTEEPPPIPLGGGG